MGAWLAAVYLWIVHWTSRKTILNAENDLYTRGIRCLYSAFHQGILYNTVAARNRGILVMISQSRDGWLGAQLVKRFGWVTLRGSSSRGGESALAELHHRLLTDKAWGSMVCDGPSGPYGMPKSGIVILARDTGLPIVPVAWWSTRQLILKSWDHALLPLPFGRLCFAWGEPIYVPGTVSPEERKRFRALLSHRTVELLQSCQTALGEPRRDFRGVQNAQSAGGSRAG